jgi:hypothetical protein
MVHSLEACQGLPRRCAWCWTYEEPAPFCKRTFPSYTISEIPAHQGTVDHRLLKIRKNVHSNALVHLMALWRQVHQDTNDQGGQIPGSSTRINGYRNPKVHENDAVCAGIGFLDNFKRDVNVGFNS